MRKKAASAHLEEDLFREYGPFAPLGRVWRLLSYPSVEAARKSFARGTSPVEGLRLSGRRGTYVKTAEVADWVNKATTSVDEKVVNK
jgi:arginyl-tRNA synthetase